MLVGRPDAFVSREAGGAAVATAAGIVPPAYARLPHAVDILREPFLLIRDGASREVVTVIEVLSPTNKKPGPDRSLYLAKRRRYLAGATNLVEIDLLRGWERMPLDELLECDYCVAVSRPEERPRVAVWPIGLRDRLPEVPVPLRPGEREATLDLQELLNRVFDDLRFGNYIHRNRPQPPLSPEDAAWANGVLSDAGTD